jgi:hypothetical protein
MSSTCLIFSTMANSCQRIQMGSVRPGPCFLPISPFASVLNYEGVRTHALARKAGPCDPPPPPPGTTATVEQYMYKDMRRSLKERQNVVFTEYYERPLLDILVVLYEDNILFSLQDVLIFFNIPLEFVFMWFIQFPAAIFQLKVL